MTLILPGIRTSPMCVEGLLHLLHLFDSSNFSIFLHARVNGCVNLQSFCIVGVGTFVTIVFTTPFLHPVTYSLSEVVGFPVVGVFYTIVEFDFNLFQ